MTTLNHWIVIDKALGVTSNDVLRDLKRLLNVKKMGHAGTLDPLASGVLPVAIGEATKTVPYIQDREKEYEFTVEWGKATNTDDAEGEVIETSDGRPDRGAIEAILPQFTGAISQVPPKFSAIKIDGKRAYAMARAGEEVELKAREVQILRLEVIDTPDIDHASFRVTCGKGTYVRSLARDIARALGTCGYVTQLRRTRVGNFQQNQAISLDFLAKIEYGPHTFDGFVPIKTALDDIPVLPISASQEKILRNGGAFPLLTKAEVEKIPNLAPGMLLLTVNDQQTPVAITRFDRARVQPVRIFNL